MALRRQWEKNNNIKIKHKVCARKVLIVTLFFSVSIYFIVNESHIEEKTREKYLKKLVKNNTLTRRRENELKANCSVTQQF